jgi:hypothetical protein
MQRWSDFIVSHPQAYLFSALVSNRLPNGLVVDKNGKRSPTPYKLLNEWLKVNTSGPYSMTWVSDFVVLGLVDARDRENVLSRFGPCRSGGPTVGNRKASILRNCMDGSCLQLADELGYEIDLRSTGDT